MITWAVFIAKVIMLKNRASDSWVAEKKSYLAGFLETNSRPLSRFLQY